VRQKGVPHRPGRFPGKTGPLGKLALPPQGVPGPPQFTAPQKPGFYAPGQVNQGPPKEQIRGAGPSGPETTDDPGAPGQSTWTPGPVQKPRSTDQGGNPARGAFGTGPAAGDQG